MENEPIFPMKLYRLGEPPLTVNAKADYDFYLKKGFSTTAQTYNYQNFPKVLYHVSDGSKTVRDQDELTLSLSLGWNLEPKKISNEEEIKAKIAFHDNAILELQKEYKALTGEYHQIGYHEKFNDNSNLDEKGEEIKDEKEVVFNGTKLDDTSDPEKKKRGRPKKG